MDNDWKNDYSTSFASSHDLGANLKSEPQLLLFSNVHSPCGEYSVGWISREKCNSGVSHAATSTGNTTVCSHCYYTLNGKKEEKTKVGSRLLNWIEKNYIIMPFNVANGFGMVWYWHQYSPTFCCFKCNNWLILERWLSLVGIKTFPMTIFCENFAFLPKNVET